MRRLLIAIVTVLAFCATASPALAANPIAFTDPAGDGAGLADVTRVTVEDMGTGFAFTVEVTNLVETTFVAVFINADRNAQTGATQIGGADYILISNNMQYAFLRWNGADFDPVADDITIAFQNGQLTFTILKSLMANTQKIDLVVVGGSDASESEDAAPNTGVFTYLPAITRLLVPGSVSAVRAGAVLNARTVQAQMTPVPGQTVNAQGRTLRCTLSYRGRAIIALAGGCRWRIPRAWRGRRLTLRITATVGTESRTQTVTVRVR
jgi:hypothetical protein